MARGRSKAAQAKSENGKAKNSNGANGSFEANLFLAADKLRKNLEPSDYKHVVLGLIFMRHVSSSFEAKHAALLQANAKQPTIGKLIDEAMLAIETSKIPERCSAQELQPPRARQSHAQ